MSTLLNFTTFEEYLTPVLLKLIHRTKRKGTLPSTFYKASINLLPKPDKNTTATKRKLYL
jgi:hypothetical protein